MRAKTRINTGVSVTRTALCSHARIISHHLLTPTHNNGIVMSTEDDYDKLSKEEREERDKADRAREAEEQAGVLNPDWF